MNIDEKGKWRTPGKKDKLRRRKETQDRKGNIKEIIYRTGERNGRPETVKDNKSHGGD
jgi:hypothetical protein